MKTLSIALLIVTLTVVSVNASIIEICKYTEQESDQEFQFNPNWTNSFVLKNKECWRSGNLGIGSYEVQEAELDGWTLDDISCTNENIVQKDLTNRKVVINFKSDEISVTCDFINKMTDTDGDGLPDVIECSKDIDPIMCTGTDPLNPDTDGDGVSDGDEINNGTDPLDPESYIPEFPTIALPLAALFGVLLLLRRR